MYRDGASGKRLARTTTIKKKLISPAKGMVSFSCLPLDNRNMDRENRIDPTNKIRKVMVGKPSAKA